MAILGFEKLSRFPEVATTKIWNGVAVAGQEKLGFWHVLFFAWFCNLAMHVGLSDMAIFRYARKWTYGFYTAFGMYPGHMLARVASGIMVAAVGREMHPGLMAYEAVGIAGVAGVLLAGWTTANPTLYRSGLALQTITPGWPRCRRIAVCFIQRICRTSKIDTPGLVRPPQPKTKFLFSEATGHSESSISRRHRSIFIIRPLLVV